MGIKKKSVLLILMVSSVTFPRDSFAEPVSTKFTYQGQLKNDGTPLTGTVDLQFTLWNTVDGGGVMRSTHGALELSGTIAQPDAGELTNGSFSLTGGFWLKIVPGDCGEDGAVSLVDFSRFPTCATGPAGAVPEQSCICLDLNNDHVMDLTDFAILHTRFNGE